MNTRIVATAAGAAGLVVLGGIAWALRSGPGEPASTLPEELSVAALRSRAEDSARMASSMRENFERADLSEEQRRELGRNMREAMRSMMRERVDEYLAADPEQRNAVLDRHIDDFRARMEHMREIRRQREKERESQAEGQEEDWRERMRQRRGGGTTEQRKTRSEGRNPDDMARTMAYMQAVRQRMTERGIEMPRFGGRGRGGGGPGRGFGPP